MPPSSPRCLPRPGPAPPRRAADAAPRLSGPDYLEWSNAIIGRRRTRADMRRRMGAAALELAASDGSEPDALARGRRRAAAQPPLAATAGAHPGGRCPDRRTGRVRPPLRRRPGGRRRRQHLGDDALPHRREPVPQRRLPTQRERRPGGGVRAGPGALAVRRPVADAAGVGHGPRHPGRRAARRGQRGRDGLPRRRRGDVFNANALDPSTRLPAARGGHDQGRALAERLADFWR